MKDLFSTHAKEYAKFRPNYPKVLFDFVVDQCPEKKTAWDCGTGNGQIAAHLSGCFNLIEATDISENQLENAIIKPNIRYTRQSAESTDFPDNQFDLITVGQAIHWFDFEGFYKEVNRTAKRGALILVLGYGMLKVSREIDQIIDKLYRKILDTFWEPERRYIDEKYLSIPFPFEEIPVPEYLNEHLWNFDQIWGYLQTWSAVKKYQDIHHQDPLKFIENELKDTWGKVPRNVEFPLLVRLGSIKN